VKSKTKPVNEWGFVSYETLVALGNSAKYCKLKQWYGLVVDERELHSTPLSS